MIIWVREHPYLSGLLIVGLLILLFLWFRRRSGSVNASAGVVYFGPSESLQAQQIAAGTALQQTSMAAQVRVAEVNAQLQATELLSAADVQKTFLAQQVELERIYGSVDYGKYSIDAQKAIALAQIGQTAPLTVPVTSTPVISGSISGGGSGAVSGGGSGTGSYAGANTVLPYGGTPGQTVHGVTLTQCDPASGDPACAGANQAAVNQSYAQNSGAYLGGGIYAGTEAAYDAYGPGSQADAYAGAETFADQYRIYEEMLRSGQVTR